MKSLDATLLALAEPTRRGVIDLLSAGPRRAGELAEAFGMSAPAMSRHLRVLRTRGLIEEVRTEHDARLRLFRLRRKPFSELTQWLSGVEEFWKEQLDSFQAHVARRQQKRKR